MLHRHIFLRVKGRVETFSSFLNCYSHRLYFYSWNLLSQHGNLNLNHFKDAIIVFHRTTLKFLNIK